mmetsp:Transcript_28306/g.57192  ORF Transcript_28306/g.57192 Transcript_28306/m.57192 type:complete len:102 (-) Transcript_28306:277-582(-)
MSFSDKIMNFKTNDTENYHFNHPTFISHLNSSSSEAYKTHPGYTPTYPPYTAAAETPPTAAESYRIYDPIRPQTSSTWNVSSPKAIDPNWKACRRCKIRMF